MQAIIDQLAYASGNAELLRQLVVWLAAAAAFILVLGGAILAMNRWTPRLPAGVRRPLRLRTRYRPAYDELTVRDLVPLPIPSGAYP